jgi:uncharacterized membrane protein YkoI
MKHSSMSLKLSTAIAALLGALVAAAAVPALADDDHVTARKLRQSGQIMPLEKIIERARAEKPGDVLETEFDRKNGRYVYEVEIVDEAGQVWEIKLDASTGALIEIERDD